MRPLRLLCATALLAVLAAGAAGAAALPKERYTPIETALTAQAAFSTQPTEEVAELAADSCATLDEDAFLKRYRALCTARLQGGVAIVALDGCKRPADCRTAVKEAREAVKDVLAAGKRFNQAADKAVSDRSCLRALDVDAEERRGLRSLDGALERLGVGLRDRSARKVREAERRLARVRGIPSAEQNLGRLQRACAEDGTEAPPD